MNLMMVLLFVGLVAVLAVAGFVIWLRLKNRIIEMDEWDLVISGGIDDDSGLNALNQRKKNRWHNRGAISKASRRRYSEINKGPDRPSRSRGMGKAGMNNRSERNTQDWQTDTLVNRIVGRRDAHRSKKKITAEPPKKKPRPK